MSTGDLLKTVLEFVAICALVYCFHKEEKIIEIEDRIASSIASYVETLMNTNKENTVKNEKKFTSQEKR